MVDRVVGIGDHVGPAKRRDQCRQRDNQGHAWNLTSLTTTGSSLSRRHGPFFSNSEKVLRIESDIGTLPRKPASALKATT
jgi:hypothetical protein